MGLSPSHQKEIDLRADKKDVDGERGKWGGAQGQEEDPVPLSAFLPRVFS
jgi:hypothetical protein